MTTLLNGFHAALSTSAAGLEALLSALASLESTEHPTQCGLFRGDAGVVAVVGFHDSRAATLANPRLKAAASALGAHFIDLNVLDLAGRAAFESHLKTFAQHATAATFAHALGLLNGSSTPLLRLDFDDFEALFSAWASTVARGALWVPSHRPAGEGADFRLEFVVAGQSFSGSTAKLAQLDAPSPDGKPGFWLEVTPSEQLAMLFTLHARERRQGRAAETPDGVVRAATRFETLLEVSFDTMPELASQWATDISHGGMFISCPTPPNLRSRVGVTITLPDSAKVSLEAEVVHRVVSGPRPGAGVQFVDRSPEALAPIRALLAQYQRRTPRVLVVDDEAIWRSTLARVLTGMGCEVQLAADGREGLVKLIDGYFELDLVILDLHMPNLDGRGLIERVRRQGGDSGLKLFLFSAAGPDELQSLAQPGLATGVFSKLDSIDSLSARIARELGISPPPTGKAKAA